MDPGVAMLNSSANIAWFESCEGKVGVIVIRMGQHVQVKYHLVAKIGNHHVYYMWMSWKEHVIRKYLESHAYICKTCMLEMPVWSSYINDLIMDI